MDVAEFIRTVIDWCPVDHLVTQDHADEMGRWFIEHFEQAGVTVNEAAAEQVAAKLPDASKAWR